MAAHQDDQSRGEADADDVADDDLPVQILEVRDGAIHQGGDEETDQTQNADSNVDIHSQTFCQVDTRNIVNTSAIILCVRRKFKYTYLYFGC